MTSMARQRNMAQNKEQIKSPEKQLSNKEIAYLSEFKTLVIRMLTEMVEHGHKIEEEVKAMKMYREPTMKGRKPELKSMV